MDARIQIQRRFQGNNLISPTTKCLIRTTKPTRPPRISATQPLLLHFAGLVFTLLAAICLPQFSHAQENSAPLDFQQLTGSIENTLNTHRDDLSTLKVRVDQLEILESTIATLIQASESENLTHSELLLMAQPLITSLKFARRKNLQTLKTLAEQYETLEKQGDAGSIILKQISEQAELTQKQRANILESALPDDQKKEIETTLDQLIQVLKAKRHLGERNLQINGELKRQLKVAIDKKTALGEKIATQLKRRIKESIFTPTNHYRDIRNTLPAAISALGSRLNALFSLSLWKTQWSRFKLGSISRWAIFTFWIVTILWLHARYRGILQQVEETCEASNRFYRGLLIFLLRRSLLFLGMALLFGIYGVLDKALFDIGLELVLFQTFKILLITQWGLDYLEHGLCGPPTVLRAFVSGQFNQLIRILRAVFIGGTFLFWASGGGSVLIMLSIDLLAVGLLAWTLMFWRRLIPVLSEGVRQGEAGPDPFRFKLVKGWSYLVAGGMLFLCVAGYNPLAARWFLAWVQTVTLLFLGWIILSALREWHRDFLDQRADDEGRQLGSAHQLRRSLILFLEIVWFFCLARGLIWAWDYSDLLMSRVMRLLNATVKIGSLNLSLKGILAVSLILFMTHLLVRIGCSLLQEFVLDKRELERGFKDSILTVSRYLGWALGLLLALGAIGVDTTSLAVVFGALSIGIGFGLQTIFNNFISGLILLFERPIQVGDTIEINGIWAEVKKINVRATVVQTFDNASVIIPNSEFISQQVTNWTFKDARIRRNLEVGVAYGSDIDLVEKTLLKIAKDNSNVLKYPQPQVLFIDHAASALIFRLRIWVHLDHYWSVPHNVRREIDRRFRELNIEIAFNQQDVHLDTQTPLELRILNNEKSQHEQSLDPFLRDDKI